MNQMSWMAGAERQMGSGGPTSRREPPRDADAKLPVAPTLPKEEFGDNTPSRPIEIRWEGDLVSEEAINDMKDSLKRDREMREIAEQ